MEITKASTIMWNSWRKSFVKRNKKVDGGRETMMANTSSSGGYQRLSIPCFLISILSLATNSEAFAFIPQIISSTELSSFSTPPDRFYDINSISSPLILLPSSLSSLSSSSSLRSSSRSSSSIGNVHDSVTATTTTAMKATQEKDNIVMKEDKGQTNRHRIRRKSIVMKFGGSSLSTPAHLIRVSSIVHDLIYGTTITHTVKEDSSNDDDDDAKKILYRPRAIIVSAMGRTTNDLHDAGDAAAAGDVEGCALAFQRVKDRHDMMLDSLPLFQDDNSEDGDNNNFKTATEEKRLLRIEIDNLLESAKSLLEGVGLVRELSSRVLDLLLSHGERCSVRIIAAYLRNHHNASDENYDDEKQLTRLNARAYDAWDAGVITDHHHGDANIHEDCADSIRDAFRNINGRGMGFDAYDHHGVEDGSDEVVAVVTGFIARSVVQPPPKEDDFDDDASIDDSNHVVKRALGQVTTLGRGGSDLTATVIGAALNVDEVQIWKDVDGILSTDPRLLDPPETSTSSKSSTSSSSSTSRNDESRTSAPNLGKCVRIDCISYEEASELAFFGARILHPVAMRPAMVANVPVRVKNSYNPGGEGTLICSKEWNDAGVNGMEIESKTDKDGAFDGEVVKSIMRQKRLVTAITCKRNVQLIDVRSESMTGTYGFLSNVFRTLSDRCISADVLASSEVSVSFTLDRKQDPTLVKAAVQHISENYAEDICVRNHMAILTLIADISRSSEVLSKVFTYLNNAGINVEMMSQGASKVNISFVLRDDEVEDTVKGLHHQFFELS